MVRDGFEADVAIKLLRSDVDPSTQAAQRLRDEARMLGLVRHPAVPKVYDLVELDGRMALVSEYIEGADLRQCLRDSPPIPLRPCLEVLADVADALQAAWCTPLRDGTGTLQIVHRDLKPANIRIDRDGVPKLLDFGIAWTESISRAAQTQTAALIGSPAYMAPERFDGSEPAPANDIYALGCVLYECVTGQRLFGHLGFRTLAGIALFAERFQATIDERMEAIPAEVDPEIAALLRECLRWSPQRRPSAVEVAQRMRAVEERIDGPTLRAWCRKREWPQPKEFESPWVGRTLIEGRQTVRETRVDNVPREPTWQGPTPGANMPSDLAGETIAVPPDPETIHSVEVEALPEVSAVMSVPIDMSAPRRAITPRPPRASVTPLLLASGLVLLSATLLYVVWTGSRPAIAPTPTAAPVVLPQSATPAPVAILQTTPTPAPTPTARPRTPRPAVRSTPHPTPVAARPTPTPTARPTPTPKMVARIAPPVATPTPAHTPPPAPRYRATTSSSDGIRVALVARGRTYPLPADVPAGTYVVHAEFTSGLPVPAGEVKVHGPVRVHCVAAFKTCNAR